MSDSDPKQTLALHATSPFPMTQFQIVRAGQPCNGQAKRIAGQKHGPRRAVAQSSGECRINKNLCASYVRVMTRAPSVLQSAQALDVIEASMERDKFLNAEEAKEFGLIDEVLTSRPPIADEMAASGKDE